MTENVSKVMEMIEKILCKKILNNHNNCIFIKKLLVSLNKKGFFYVKLQPLL